MKYIAGFQYGDALPKDDAQDGKFKVFGSNGAYSNFSETNTEAPVIIIGRKGSYGKINWTDEACYASDTTFFIDEKSTKQNLRWLYYGLQTLDLDVGSNETAVPGLSRDDAYEKTLFLPPVEDQRAIAAMLDRETTRLDELITEKEHLLALLAEKRRALITSAVTRGLNPNAPLVDSGVEWLGEIPRHWKTPPIYARYEIQLGKMLDERQITGTQLRKYLRNVDVQWGKINTEDLPEMDFSPDDRERYSLKVSDILICEGGEIGRTAIWKENSRNIYYQKALHRLRPRTQKDSPDFFLYVMHTLVDLGVFVAMSSASTILHLPAEKLSIVRYPSPPLEEQQTIVKYIEAETGKIDRLQAATTETIELLKERRSSLIEAAVTGKISVHEMK